MISVILATEDPYRAKDEFLKAGWEMVFETPRESNDNLACVIIGDSKVMLGIDSPEFLPKEAKGHRGAGVDIYIEFASKDEIEIAYRNHLKAGFVTEKLSHKPWGAYAFHAKICGYSFLFATES